MTSAGRCFEKRNSTCHSRPAGRGLRGRAILVLCRQIACRPSGTTAAILFFIVWTAYRYSLLNLTAFPASYRVAQNRQCPRDAAGSCCPGTDLQSFPPRRLSKRFSARSIHQLGRRRAVRQMSGTSTRVRGDQSDD